MTPQGQSINQALVDALLTMRATVYARTGGTGAFNRAIRTGLPCLLEPVSRQPAATGADRRALAAIGTLRYDATYAFPAEAVQVEVDAFPGQRWNTTPATDGTVSKTIDLTRAS